MTRFCSIFNQLLQLFPRTEFQRAVQATNAERHARGFACWDQFVAMLFAQLGRAHSLREICGGLASCEGKLAHLGVTAPRRSTLAYANAHRPWQLYQAVFYQVLGRCREVAGGEGGLSTARALTRGFRQSAVALRARSSGATQSASDAWQPRAFDDYTLLV
ncbi:MAG TPA: DUF4372 domain-containing protein [Vicinamibacterales bacterium]